MYKVSFFCFVSFYFITLNMCYPLCKENILHCYKNNSAVKRLQEYIRIDTTNSQNLELSTEFWRRQAKDLGLEFAEYRPAGLPICVLTWKGSDPDLPGIMLNSHADVVPVYESLWTYPPFEAHIDENGDMYGRGTQDTKSLTIQYLEAIRKLKKSNVVLKRSLHITVMPDEETGGFKGMVAFVGTEEFKSLNIGFALDEGLTSNDNTFAVTYLDKRPWHMKFTMRAEGGHSFELPATTSVQKLQKLLNMTLSYRELQRPPQNSSKNVSEFTTLNVNVIQGGIATNILPSYISAVIDMRLSSATTVEEIQGLIDSWQQALGNGTTVEFLRRVERSEATLLNDHNPFWVAMQDAAKELDVILMPVVCPAASDMIEIRNIGIPAVGFAPRRNMISRIHDNNEYIPLDIFMEGIDIYVAILKNIGDLD